MKVAQADLPDVLEKFRGTFETIWENPEFEPFAPGESTPVALVGGGFAYNCRRCLVHTILTNVCGRQPSGFSEQYNAALAGLCVSTTLRPSSSRIDASH